VTVVLDPGDRSVAPRRLLLVNLATEGRGEGRRGWRYGGPRPPGRRLADRHALVRRGTLDKQFVVVAGSVQLANVRADGARGTPGNQIADASDMAIVLYRTTSHPQHSVVRGNTALSAGTRCSARSAWIRCAAAGRRRRGS
jgi:hypothetical protein